VKVVAPTRLLAEAAEVLEPFRDHVVVVGAAALEVALSGVVSVATTATRDLDLVVITPTRDVDVVVPVDRAGEVVGHLEAVGLHRSDVPHERAFTWVRGDLKVQLVRTFHPFPSPPARSLPSNPVFGMATEPGNQVIVAFVDDPGVARLVCANAASVLALKQAAFGRTSAPDDTPVERDFHDAYLLISAVPDVLVAEFAVASYEVRQRASDAVAQLVSGGHATQAAARQMVRLRAARTQREAEAAIRRSAMRIQERLADA
jgi:hypothetical protein